MQLVATFERAMHGDPCGRVARLQRGVEDRVHWGVLERDGEGPIRGARGDVEGPSDCVLRRRDEGYVGLDGSRAGSEMK